MSQTKNKTEDLPIVYLYTDGACLGNPGPGGWAAILKNKDHYRELSGGQDLTTNNQMELMALIKGLEALKRKCKVIVYTDSKYIYNSITKGWLENWEKSNWKNSSKKLVKNKELWVRLLALLKRHQVEINWVKAHSGHKENERCDTIARKEAKKRQNESLKT